MGNFKEDIARIRAFVFDVDGVMTDGGITVTPEGEFLRTFYAKDGYALSLALKKGYRIAIITGGRGKALQVRFDMIGIEHVYTNCHHKLKALHELRDIWGMEPDEIMYMGDDVPDLEPMTHVGMPVCPADAAMEVIGISRYVSQFNGGAGCVRDVVEQVMRARGDWYKLGDDPGEGGGGSRYRSRRDNRSAGRRKPSPHESAQDPAPDGASRAEGRTQRRLNEETAATSRAAGCKASGPPGSMGTRTARIR